MDNQITTYQQKALKIIQETPGAFVFMNENDIYTDQLFRPEVAVLKMTENDFHDLKTGQFEPKKHIIDAASEFAGIQYIKESFREYIVPNTKKYVCEMQGKKRQSDGSWKTSSICSYEFDVELRARAAFAKNPGKYKSEIEKEKKLIELEMFARQKANTGAKARVVRELTCMKLSYTSAEKNRPMIFSKVVTNTDKLLESPEMRGFVIEHALNGATDIFPGMKNITPEPQQIEDNTTQEKSQPENDELPDFLDTQNQINPEITRIRKKIGELIDQGQGILSEKQIAKLTAIMEQDEKAMKDILFLNSIFAWITDEIAKKKKGGENEIY